MFTSDVGLTHVMTFAILFLACRVNLLAGRGGAALSFASNEIIIKYGITKIPVTILRNGSNEGTANFILQIDWMCDHNHLEPTCSIFQRGFMLDQQRQSTSNIDLTEQMVSQTKNTIVSLTLIPTANVKLEVGNPNRMQIIYDKETHDHQKDTRSTEV
jgi:hypothetical protein